MNSLEAHPPLTAPPTLSTRPARSRFVTVFAFCLMGVSALGCIVSAMALLMVLAGGPGSRNTTLVDAFVVLGLPPLALLTSFGLLFRRRWAQACTLVLLGGVIAWNLAPMLRGPTPERRYVSPAGVPTTVLASPVDYPRHIVVVAVALVLISALLSKRVRDDFRATPPARGPAKSKPLVLSPPAVGPKPGAETARNWRVGHQGRDEMYYEEHIPGGWQRLRISGEMLTGRAHHVIYFASPQAWLDYPAWARDRREEIIARIKSEFRAPDYEYQGDGTDRVTPSPAARASAPVSSVPAARRAAVAPARSPSSSLAVVVALALLLTLTAAMSWLVGSGLTKGTTYLPMKYASQSRMVARASEPAFFWVSISLYALVGAGALGLAAWGVRKSMEGRR
jgi:hypothetical protein